MKVANLETSNKPNLFFDWKPIFNGRDMRQEWESKSHLVAPTIARLTGEYDPNQLYENFLRLPNLKHLSFENNISKNFSNIYPTSETYFAKVIAQPLALAVNYQLELDALRGIPWHKRKLSLRKKLEALRTLNDDYDPLSDERVYTEYPAIVKNMYLGKILSKFKSHINRVRFSILQPGEGLKPHIDIEPQLGARLHIPIKTNKDSFLYFQPKGGPIRQIHLEQGQCYYINTGIKHWAHNYGVTDRLHLIICCEWLIDPHEEVL